MKISKKAEYAIRAILILADSPPNQPLQMQDLSETGSIPLKFLEQIMLLLKKGAIVRSKRGVGGGYQLNRPARSISLGEIIQIVDGSLCSLGELLRASGNHGAPAPSFPGVSGLETSFQELDDLVNSYLLGKSVEDILAMDRPEDVLAFEI